MMESGRQDVAAAILLEKPRLGDRMGAGVEGAVQLNAGPMTACGGRTGVNARRRAGAGDAGEGWGRGWKAVATGRIHGLEARATGDE